MRKISRLEESSPIGLEAKVWPEQVTKVNAAQAINDIQNSNSGGKTLEFWNI